jgi:hypothetical protein
MSHHTCGARRPRPSFAALSALDFGLRVRVETQPSQQTIFSGAENLSAQALTSELAVLVSRLRVHSFWLRGQLEHVTSALMLNVRCGFWSLARRAALDLAGCLVQARKRHLADAELAYRAANAALRIAGLCGQEVR